jgi:hypothetical protein
VNGDRQPDVLNGCTMADGIANAAAAAGNPRQFVSAVTDLGTAERRHHHESGALGAREDGGALFDRPL